MEKKAIITGASGHIGFNVANQLLKRNYKITILYRTENINIRRLKNTGAELIKCDLFDPESYKKHLSGKDVVFHLAAENTTSKANPQSVIRNSVDLTKIFLDTCIESNVPKIVYTSSVVVLGRSNSKKKLLTEKDRTDYFESPYVEGKFKAEQYVEKLIEEKNADIRRIYPSWVVGPNDPKLTPPHKIIKDYVAKGQFFYFKGGISIVEAEALANAHIDAFEKGSQKGAYIVSGENITFKQFYNLLAKYTKHSKPWLKIPKWVIVSGARFFKWVFKMFGMEPIIEPSYAKKVFGNYSWYNPQKAIDELGYKIVPASEIIRDAVEEAHKRIAGTTKLGEIRKPNVVANDEEDTLLITGVPGWLGNRMVDILINGDRFGEFKSHRKVKLLVQNPYEGMLNLPENYEIVYGDLLDKKALREAVKDVKTVFHIAGAIYPKKIKVLYKVNVDGTKNLVDACIEEGVRRIVYMSTDSTVGKGTKKNRIFDENTPPSPYKNYGKSKYQAEKYILDKTREGKIDGTSLRGFWFFGPFAPDRQKTFVKMFDLPKQLVFGKGKNYRSISHVDNIIQAFFKAEKNENTFGKCYWIAGNEHTMTVDDIYQIAADKLGKKYKPLYIPIWMCKMFGLADTILGKFGYLNSSLHAAGKFYFDIAGKIDAAKRDFGYNPKISYEDAAEELKEL
jgi:dihydroflavonol-4-reductase